MNRPTRNTYVTPELVVNAYFQGFFPMANEHGQIGFYSFDPRGIVPLDERFTVRRSLRQILKKDDFTVHFDRDPLTVLHACSRQGESPTYELWLSDELIDLYMELYDMGYVHTVEVYRTNEEGEERLVGGLYGLAFGGVFCGESMFSREPYASQIALVHLVERLRLKNFQVLDAQMASDHLKQFGLYELDQESYVNLFLESAAIDTSF